MKNAIEVREKVVDTLRKFFKDRGFQEVFTPVLVPVPSIEPNLEVFETEVRTFKGKKRKGYLILSPEYSIKKLLSQGVGSCFEITRCFRNEEEVSRLHNPEFTMLEWYRVGADYTAVMKDFEELFVRIVGGNKLTYQGEAYDLTLPWPRVSFAEAFRKYAGKKIGDVKNEDFYKIFFNEIEPKLKATRKPTIVYDYPISQAALARPKASDPRFAERFEVFLAGLELGNCFSELTDAKLQQERFEKDYAERKHLGKTLYPIDGKFIEALGKGIPPTAGIAVGVDRLIMLAGDFADIAQTLTFPAGELFDL